MRNPEIEKIIHDYDLIIRLLVAGASFLVGLLSLIIGIILKLFRDFKNDANCKIDKHMKDLNREIIDIKQDIGKLDEGREKNSGAIIAIKHDLNGIAKLCRERHRDR